MNQESLTFYMFIVAPLIAWCVAQGLKRVFVRYNRRAKVIDQTKKTQLLIVSGGMPSAHSATVTALSTVVALTQGLNSPLFAVSLMFSVVVLYDAIMVRYSSGKQGDAIVELLKEQKSKVTPPRVAHGHTPVEVLAGTAIGVVIGVVVFIATR